MRVYWIGVFTASEGSVKKRQRLSSTSFEDSQGTYIPQIAALDTFSTDHCRIDVVVGTWFPDRLKLAFSRCVCQVYRLRV